MYRADVAAFNAAGELTLAVETKSKRGTSTSWATQMRRNLLAHGVVNRARFFLLALPDRFYLWKDARDPAVEFPPSYEIDPTSLLAPYFARANLPPEAVSGRSFELIVEDWLRDLLVRDELPQGLTKEHPWITESGLFDALKGGRVAHEVAA